MWNRLIAPALAAILLAGIAVLAVTHYAALLGVPPGSIAAWALPTGYVAAAVIGVCWGLVIRTRRPGVYQAIGHGAHAAVQTAAAVRGRP